MSDDTSPTQSSILWKGYNEDLDMNMSVLYLDEDSINLHVLVVFECPSCRENHVDPIEIYYRKDRWLQAVEDGTFLLAVNNTYINGQLAVYRDYVARGYRVN